MSFAYAIGTTQCCVAVYRNGQVEIIPNKQGNRTTAAYVAFTETGRLLGDEARAQAYRNPKNTIFDSKRLIGRRFKDSPVQSDMKRWPFKVVSVDHGKPEIQIECKGETKTLSPEEVTSMFLANMKKIAEEYLGCTIEDAAISIPAYYNDSQRQSIKDAAGIAGLNVLKIMNSVTCSAIAYYFRNRSEAERFILIIDVGGGTTDVSIVAMEDRFIEIRSTCGDFHLGGEDFDNRLVNHFVAEFKEKYQKDLTTDPKALLRLRSACEVAKCQLNSSIKASIDIDYLFDGIDFHLTITREGFKQLCADLFRNIMDPIEKVIRYAELNKGELHNIVLTGESSRIPKIQKLVSDFFPGKELNKSIHPVESVAYGAAVKAGILFRNGRPQFKEINLQDLSELSLD